MNLNQIMPFLIHTFKSEADLVRTIEEVSLKFTKERDKIGDYLKEPKLIAAYTAFYLTSNLPKLGAVMNWMSPEWVELLKSCDLVDLGAGPGTFSLAWKEFGGTGSVYQIETSSLMRDQAKKIWKGLGYDNLFQSSRWEWNSDRPKILLFGHSANEMGASLAIEYIEKINPEHILFIEPGTKDFFPIMLTIREALLRKKFNVLYPCPNSLECPMKGSESDWCHQFIQVKQEMDMDRLAQMARKDRRLLPLTVHAYSRTFQKENPHERIVRVLPETKFSFEWEMCHDNQLEHYQIMKRGMDKSRLKEMDSYMAGDAIVSELDKVVEKSKRVKIL